jgi:hypothetical protein
MIRRCDGLYDAELGYLTVGLDWSCKSSLLGIESVSALSSCRIGQSKYLQYRIYAGGHSDTASLEALMSTAGHIIVISLLGTVTRYRNSLQLLAGNDHFPENSRNDGTST